MKCMSKVYISKISFRRTQWSPGPGLRGGCDEPTEENSEPKAKRKKELSGNDIIEKLKENEYDIGKAVNDMLEELCPFDINDEEALKIEGRVERLQKTSNLLQKKLWRLRKKIKEKKFRHEPELLDKKFISSSQYSIFDSQEVDVDGNEENEDEEVDSADEEWVEGAEVDGERPRKYRKKPLDRDLSKFSRRRRVAGKRELLKEWAEEEGVTLTKLLGYFLHLENYPENRDLAAAGWLIFQGGKPRGKPDMSLEEAIWLREKSGMSEAVMQELRLRLLDRYKRHITFNEIGIFLMPLISLKDLDPDRQYGEGRKQEAQARIRRVPSWSAGTHDTVHLAHTE